MSAHPLPQGVDYNANDAIPIREETRIVELDGTTVNIPARVVHELYPHLRLVVECAAPPQLVSRLGETVEIRLADGEELSAILGIYSPIPLPTGRELKDKLFSAVQPYVTTNAQVPIRTAEFLLINFLKFYGATDTVRRGGGRVERVGRLHLQADQWDIEIRAVDRLGDKIEVVKATRGYCVTHKGTITRADGGSFSSGELEELVKGLEMFLSFARSRSCGIALIDGFDDQRGVVWSRWGSPHVTPGAGVSRWLKKNLFDDELAEIFPDFWKHYRTSNGSLANIIDWYLNSAETSMHAGIILSQVALESLASYILRRDKGGQPAADFIHDALGQLGLQNAVSVTNALPDLCQHIQAQNWRHGSHALAKLRNNLVHSDQTTADGQQ